MTFKNGSNTAILLGADGLGIRGGSAADAKTCDNKSYRGGGFIIRFTDACWDDDMLLNKRSTPGYVIMLAGAPISWSFKRQQTVAMSTCEAEHIGQCNAVMEAVWLRGFLGKCGCHHEGPITIYADNQSASALANNPVYHRAKRSLHYHYTRQATCGTVSILYIATSEMVVDGTTKAVAKVKH